jgi:hypothetical protein
LFKDFIEFIPISLACARPILGYNWLLMKFWFGPSRIGVALAAITLSSSVWSAFAADLTAQQIIAKTVRRAQAIRAANRQADYSYTKFAITEEFNNKGKLTEKKEKVFQYEAGYGRLSQLKLNGRALSGAEFRKQDEDALQERREVTDSKSRQRDDNWEKYLTPELVAKYVFKLIGREEIHGRAAYVVSFEPASSELPVNHFIDRLSNRLGGKVWIDEEDFEIARAQVGLRGEVTLWHGVLGSLRKCNFTVERSRVDENVWFNTLTSGEFEGRKLLEPTHVRTRAESTNFKKIQRTTSAK